MHSKAPRLPARPWRRWARGARLGVCLWLAGATATSVDAQNTGHRLAANTVLNASYFAPTTAYAHGVLGDSIEWSGLRIEFPGQGASTVTVETRLPADHVFEDLHPRLVDLDLDNRPDAVMVVETDLNRGAALALYGVGGKIAETPHIGRPNRWLAPIGAADLDGDGVIEVAYIDRPHLAKTLRIWRFENGGLAEIATLPRLTNHRIGEDFITGGIRVCNATPELIVVSADWRSIVSVRYNEGWERRKLSPFTRSAMDRALACAD